MQLGPRRLAGVFAVVASLPLAGRAETQTAPLPQEPGPAHAVRVRISKGSHALSVLDGERVLATFKASIGPGGAGFKRQEGDNVTPIGRYHVVHHERSQFRIFLRLDYPNADDRSRFAALTASGDLPKDARIGGDIGIHGTPQSHDYDGKRDRFRGVDWTAGCVAVQDDEIDRVAAWVPDGAEVDIED